MCLDLSRREYFSALAMQGIINEYSQYDHDSVAERAVRMADALMLELDKKYELEFYQSLSKEGGINGKETKSDQEAKNK